MLESNNSPITVSASSMLPIHPDPTLSSSLVSMLPPYSYLQHLAHHQALTAASLNDTITKSFMNNSSKPYPWNYDSHRLPYHDSILKHYSPESLQSYVANEQSLENTLRDPMRNYLACRQELTTAAFIAAAGTAQTDPNFINNNNAVVPSEDSKHNADLIKSIGRINSSHNSSAVPVSCMNGSATNRTSLFSIESLLAPKHPPQKQPSLPSSMSIFGKYKSIISYLQFKQDCPHIIFEKK